MTTLDVSTALSSVALLHYHYPFLTLLTQTATHVFGESYHKHWWERHGERMAGGGELEQAQ
jgi:hypothetical protein